MSKKHSAEFQAKVDLSALANAQISDQLVSRFEVHPTLIPSWNRMLLESAIQLIDKSHS
jgi:transposase